jgi:restriction endonuclease Mrr
MNLRLLGVTRSLAALPLGRHLALHDARIVLIDGEKLATLMIDHGLGVTLEASYEVKRIDSDYFSEE